MVRQHQRVHAWARLSSAPVRRGPASPDPAKLDEEFNRYMTEWKGKLKGKFVLTSGAVTLRPETQVPFQRLSDKELSDLGVAPTPVKVNDIKELKFPEDPDELRRFLGGSSAVGPRSVGRHA